MRKGEFFFFLDKPGTISPLICGFFSLLSCFFVNVVEYYFFLLINNNIFF